MIDDRGKAWRTSSRCSHGDCVEVGPSAEAGVVAVRDTKNRGAGPDLTFAPAAWRSFLAGVKQSGTAGRGRPTGA